MRDIVASIPAAAFRFLRFLLMLTILSWHPTAVSNMNRRRALGDLIRKSSRSGVPLELSEFQAVNRRQAFKARRPRDCYFCPARLLKEGQRSR